MLREAVRQWPILILFVTGCSERRHDENIGRVSQPLLMGREAEPNGAVTQATPLASPKDVVVGNIMPSGDVDYYSFTGVAGERVYAATQTATSPNAQPDTVLTLLETDGTTEIETDDDNGNFTSQSSSIAGAVLPTSGTYYLRVSHYNPGLELRPYRLHFQKRNGLPQSEIEPNDAVPQTVSAVAGAGAWLAGSISSEADIDYYYFTLNAGDTIFASLDMDPERDGTDFDAYIGGGLFPNIYFGWDDAGLEPAPDSEAFFTTVQAAGLYAVRIASGATSGTGNYVLSISAHPAESSADCTTYLGKETAIPAEPGMVTSTLEVPDDIVIGDVNVNVQLEHSSPPDLDVHLVSPAGGRVGLFTDVGNPTYPDLNFTLDDEAGIPINFAYLAINRMRVQPESAYRLSWFDGERAQGTWTLELRDDQANNGGTLSSWGITICPAVAAPACQAGYVPRVVYSTDFETDDGGFTHSGAADEWARGTPTAEPITTCKSGSQCFKTDLTGTYEGSSNQELISPPIDLADVAQPVRLRWAQNLQMDNATTDHAWVEVRNVDDSNPRRVYEFLDGKMTDAVGEPPVTVNESTGWGIHEVDISAYAGERIELVFHVDSDATANLAGLAIDDVRVTGACVLACGNGSPDSGETCDDGNTTSGDGCDANCTPTGCGNGVPTAGEACDDGNLMSGDGCDGNCRIETGIGGSGGGGGLGGANAGGAAAGNGGATVGGGGASGGSAGAGGVAGAAHAGRGGLGGAGGRNATGGDAGASDTNAGEGGEGAETGTGGDAGATGGEAGEAPMGGSAGSSSGGWAGAAGDQSDAGAGGDSGETPGGSGHDDEDSGCGCRTAGKEARFGPWPFVGLAAAAVSIGRRRRRGAPAPSLAREIEE
jgi:cysteine-rich repeat protein